ncbi:Methionine gamma-lyase [Coccomyxa sp. Obi]|nr:Methionine gamma-lyase [Coccomyxa sp. Obi]
MQALGNEVFEPTVSLSCHKKEFGEFGGVNASIESSTTFTVLHAGDMPQIFEGTLNPEKGACYLYGRSFNPTVRYLGRQLAALEGTEAGYAVSSGLAAISATFLQLCNTGDHIIAASAVYGGTFALLKSFLPAKCGINTTFVDIADLDAVRAAITEKTKVIFAEAISNPTLVIADLPALANLAHENGLTFVVDNTFSPMIISPAKWGADVVVHSMTKFISGASDIIAGAICGRADFIRSLMDLHLGPIMLLGPTIDPKIASELSLRIPHLGIRMAEHSRRAMAYAQRLQQEGALVQYPGLQSHAQHHLIEKLRNNDYGYGGILTLDLGSQKAAEQFMERAQNKHAFGLLAVSLGYFETLLSMSGSTTSSELTEEEQKVAGIPAGMVRMSVGLTGSLEQRIGQLMESYTAVCGHRQLPYRAAEVVRDDKGQLQRVASWDSHGSELMPYMADSGCASTAAATTRLGSADSGEEASAPPQSLSDDLPATKIRRIGAKEFVYTRLAPAGQP